MEIKRLTREREEVSHKPLEPLSDPKVGQTWPVFTLPGRTTTISTNPLARGEFSTQPVPDVDPVEEPVVRMLPHEQLKANCGHSGIAAPVFYTGSLVGPAAKEFRPLVGIAKVLEGGQVSVADPDYLADPG